MRLASAEGGYASVKSQTMRTTSATLSKYVRTAESGLVLLNKRSTGRRELKLEVSGRGSDQTTEEDKSSRAHRESWRYS